MNISKDINLRSTALKKLSPFPNAEILKAFGVLTCNVSLHEADKTFDVSQIDLAVDPSFKGSTGKQEERCSSRDIPSRTYFGKHLPSHSIWSFRGCSFHDYWHKDSLWAEVVGDCILKVV